MQILRSPKWLAGHLLVLVVIVAFVNLGFWQLRRLDERRSFNAQVTARLEAPPVALAQLLDEQGGDPERLAYRRVTVTGRYLTEEEIRLSTRQHEGQPGHHLLTPLIYDEGRAVVVNRGWVPLALDDPPVAEALPGADGAEVTVSGVLVPGQEPAGFGVDVPEGDTEYLGVIDLDRIQQQVDPTLAPVAIQAADQTPPPPRELPVPAALPPLTEANHLNYAGQWFLFATVVAVGYPILLRRTIRDHSRPPVRATA
jgi:surfeit locus 1 family protein